MIPLSVHRTYTKTWSRSLQSFMGGRTASSTPAVSMPMLDCLRCAMLCTSELEPYSLVKGKKKPQSVQFSFITGYVDPRWCSAVWWAKPRLHHRWDPSVSSKEAALQTHGPQWSGKQAQRVSGVCGSQTVSLDTSLKCLHCDSRAVFFCSVFNNGIIYVAIRCILKTLSFLGILD